MGQASLDFVAVAGAEVSEEVVEAALVGQVLAVAVPDVPLPEHVC